MSYYLVVVEDNDNVFISFIPFISRRMRRKVVFNSMLSQNLKSKFPEKIKLMKWWSYKMHFYYRFFDIGKANLKIRKCFCNFMVMIFPFCSGKMEKCILRYFLFCLYFSVTRFYNDDRILHLVSLDKDIKSENLELNVVIKDCVVSFKITRTPPLNYSGHLDLSHNYN